LPRCLFFNGLDLPSILVCAVCRAFTVTPCPVILGFLKTRDALPRPHVYSRSPCQFFLFECLGPYFRRSLGPLSFSSPFLCRNTPKFLFTAGCNLSPGQDMTLMAAFFGAWWSLFAMCPVIFSSVLRTAGKSDLSQVETAKLRIL